MQYLSRAAIALALISISTMVHSQSPECADPNAAVWHDGPYMANLWRGICNKEMRQRQQTETAEQKQRAAIAQAATNSAADASRATIAAEGHGYKLISNFNDLLLDGKTLAASNAKIQVTGFYRKIGDSELLYASAGDAYQDTRKFILIMTDGAQRPLREHLLTYACSRPDVGCQIAVGGHMKMCHYLNVQLANYPSLPCLNVEVTIQ